MLSHRLQALLRLHPGEGTTVGLAIAVAFLADAAIMIAQSSIDALFFARYGVEKLPTMYLLVAVAMFLTTVGVAALLAVRGRSSSSRPRSASRRSPGAYRSRSQRAGSTARSGWSKTSQSSPAFLPSGASPGWSPTHGRRSDSFR